MKMQNRKIGLRSVALWQDSENIVPWLRSFTPTNSVCVMKTKWITLALMSFATSLSAAAQDYWVIETHPNELRTQVRFYDDQNTILHEESIEGKRLDVRSKSDRKLLARKLREVSKQKAMASGKRPAKNRKA